jgi:hypothetical protein
MLSFLFKTGTYIFIWKKFKTQIASSIVCIFLIWLIFSIYDDLVKIFVLKDTSILLYLLIGKWLIVTFIVLYNILLINSIEDKSLEDEKIILPKKSQELLDKKELLTRTDLILKKYKKNK